MGRTTSRVVALGLIAAFAWQANAWAVDATAPDSSNSDKAVATVRTVGGVIMLSDGGPFITAAPDAPVVTGERLLVSIDSVATVVYNDGCEQKYDKPGVYKIQPNCKRAAAMLASGGAPQTWTTGKVIGVGIGAAVLGAAIEKQLCDCNAPPVSR